MATSDHIPLSATELGTLWMAYQNKTLLMRTLEYFIEKSEGGKTGKILQSYYNKQVNHVQDITDIFQKEGAAVPIGYTGKDVNKSVPSLYDNQYDLMYFRLMAKISIGIHALHSSMSYREDIRTLNNDFEKDSLDIYNQLTDLLLKEGVLARPPYIPMPKEVEFVHDKNYMSGFNLLSAKRALNAVEISFLYQAIESNITGMQMMAGFAQAATDTQVQNYFTKGKDLAKKMITVLSDLLLQSDIQPPSTWAGNATDSTIAPFSDKLMMYNTSLFSSFGLGGNAIGASFSLRSDLPLTLFKLAQDTFSYSKEGGKIMVKNGWTEEPPQAPDRNKLAKGKK